MVGGDDPAGARLQARFGIICGVTEASPHLVRIYTQPWCSYCVAATRFFDSLAVAYEEIRLDEHPGLRERLAERTGGWRTVPMIFVGERFIGGYTDAIGLHRRDQLLPLIWEATSATAPAPRTRD